MEEGDTDFVFAFREGSPQSFSALRARARREGVTIGAAFSAASQFAFVRCLERWGGVVPRRRGRVALQMDTLFDLRRRVSPPVDPDLMTLFVGPGAVCAPVADDVEFWELARRLLHATRRTAKSGLPADFHIILDGLHDLRAAIAKYDIDYGPSGGVGSTLAISNVGKFPHPTEIGDLRIRTWFGGLAPGFGGAPVVCWLRTLGDRLMYNFAALTPVMNRARCEELADELSRTLEGCAEADGSWTLLG